MISPDTDRLLETVVACQVVEELHPGLTFRKRVSLDSSLDRDLALDSLGRVELVGRLEKEFGVGAGRSSGGHGRDAA